MFSFPSPREKDLFQKYKQQTYKLVFPLGFIINIFYMIVVAKGVEILFYFSLFQAALLLVLTILVWVNSNYLAAAESTFYFMVTTVFFGMTQTSIMRLVDQNALTPAGLADPVNSLALWLSIFMVAGFLTLTPERSLILIGYTFFGFVVLCTYNILISYFAGHMTSAFLFRWVNPLSGLMITIVLLQRMGTLQQRQATTDALTGTMNRHALYPILEQEIARAERYNRGLSLILFDLDYFKTINDTLGHLEGDRILVRVTTQVGEVIRQTDRLGRWGGEEFLIVLPEADEAVAKKLANRLREEIEKVGMVTASFGVVTYSSGDLEELLHRVDSALYQAKEKGRNQVVVL